MFNNLSLSDELDNGLTLNLNKLIESDFCVVPENTYIWNDEEGLPFHEGDKFPTPFIQDRANTFKTNKALYDNKFGGIYTNVFSLGDFLQNLYNYPVLNLVPALPDYKTITDKWCDLMAATSPRIDTPDIDKGSAVSSILMASNFGSMYQSIIRGAIFMYGNYICRVDREGRSSNPTIVEMPVKNWIPFMSCNNIANIEANCFFNIYQSREGRPLCEFMIYFEDGRIEKYVFSYSRDDNCLGELLSHEESVAFGGLGVSPIVVFTGKSSDQVTIYGDEQYRYWDASISLCMRGIKNAAMLDERITEIYRVVPAGAVKRDEQSGISILPDTGVIMYDETVKEAPEIKAIIPDSPMDKALAVYREYLVRLSRDTGLPMVIFDPKELGSTTVSGKALKAHMHFALLQAKSYNTILEAPTKMLISKMALACGIDLGLEEFSLLTDSGFMTDEEGMAEVVSKRNGGKPTLSVAQSIAILDGVPMSEAEQRANELVGLPTTQPRDLNLTSSGGDSSVTDLSLTHDGTSVKVNNEDQGRNQDFYLFGTPDVSK